MLSCFYIIHVYTSHVVFDFHNRYMIFIKVLISNTYQNRHVKQIEVHCNINLIVILLVVDLLRN